MPIPAPLQRQALRSLVLTLALLLSFTGASATAATKARCAPGTVPVITGSGPKAKLAKSKGKVRCQAIKRPKASAVEPPAGSSQGAVASTADQLLQALAVKPEALAKTHKRIGKKATAALVDRALSGWRKGVGARASRLADDGFHAKTTFGDAAKGTSGSASIDASAVNADGKLGLQASAAVEFAADAKGLKELGADKATSAKNATVKIEVSFADIPDACPDGAGKVNGRATGEAKLTITTDGVSQTISAKVDATYTITVGRDAKWKTIDNVDVQTTFTFGGSKQGSETWRGRELGGGFGEQGLLDSGKSFDDAYREQTSHVDWTKGGIFGPHSRVNNATGPTAWDIKSISNLKGLIYTQVATHLLTLGTVEYVRKVVAARVQKHWYDDEACLRLDGKPAASKLKAGQSTTVTASNAKAANGVPVDVDLKGSGVATLEPATASMPAAATKDFTLTAPNETPTKSSWTIVGTGVAGKKTVSGTLGDTPGYEVKLDGFETATFDTYASTAKLTGTLRPTAVAGVTPVQSAAGGAVGWSDFTVTANNVPCGISDVIAGGTWSAVVTEASPDTIEVSLDFSPDTTVLFSVNCPNSPPIPGQPGPRPVGFAPLKFTLPAGGGVQAISGNVSEGGDGFFSSGTVTVTPVA